MDAIDKAPITALITARDEAEVLGAALDSVAFCADVLLVDSGSTDATPEIARAKGARVLEHPYESPARQKNWALPHCRFEWVLILDADEIVTPELAEELRRVVAAGPTADGYWIRRVNLFLGRPLKRGDWGRDAVIRLVARDRARYQDRLVHEEIDLAGPLPTLRAPMLHDTFRSFDQYWPKVFRYADHGARDLLRKGRSSGPAAIVGHPFWRFFRAYALRRGFLDGTHGLVAALLDGFTTYLKYARLWELRRRGAAAGEGAGR